MAAALIDRLPYHCHIVNIRGNSYRMRQHSELWQAFHGEAERGRGEGPSVAYLSLDANRRRLCSLIGDAITLGRAARVREASGAAGEGEGG
jgi:hypothetical protein